jgi:transmembrane sensor
MDTQRLYQLFQRYAARTASPAEEQELFSLIDGEGESDIKGALLQLQASADPGGAPPDPARWQPVLDRILATARSLEGEEESPPVLTRRFPWTRLAAAAIIGLLIAGAWFFTHRPGHGETTNQFAAAKAADLPPGHSGAILTLGNGKNIILDSAANGPVAAQGSAVLVKNNNQLSYSHATTEKEMVYNSLSTPRGRQYQLVLSDGTKVWLNAASSITYPTAFFGKDRSVTITGEAYFEVAKNPAQPFKVRAGQNEIDVLGTDFDINAYPDEPAMAATLLEGSIRFAEDFGDKKKPGTILIPGQQIQLSKSGDVRLVDHADIDRVMAWRNGQFPLKGTDMAALMRQIARWYDVDIHFDGPVPEKTFGGSISRSVNLSAVLEALRENGVDCRLHGKTIEVTNNKPNP